MADDNMRDGDSPWTSRRFIGAAVIVAVIVLLGVGVAVSNLLSRPASPQSVDASPPATVSSPATPPAAADASICGLTAHARSGSISRAPDAEWTLVGTTAAPRDKHFGPGLTEESGYRHCFARTPEGAAFAAANFAAMGSQPSLAHDLAEGSVVPGAGRDALLAQAQQPSDAGGGTRTQIAGVRVLSYSDKKAQIDLAFRTSNGALGAQVFDLVWDGGDWKMEVTSNGDLLTQATQIRDLSGYVLWAGA